MFRNVGVAGSWSELVHRVQAQGVWSSWVGAEPELSSVAGPAALETALARGVSRAVADSLLGALVRLAAADGGNDPEALLVVLHLLADGAGSLARKIEHRTPDALAVVVGELTCQIRRFPWRRRTRAIAANLLLDTKNALWVGEYRPLLDPSRPEHAMLVDPVTAARVFDRADPAVPDEVDDRGMTELTDLMRWAAANQVASVEELRLLWEVQRRMDSGQTHPVAARAYGISESTLRRRRRSTLDALREHSASYLASVA